MTDDTGSPLSTGYHTRSGSEEAVTDPGEHEAGASLYQGRMRTASELLLDRWGWDVHTTSLTMALGEQPNRGRSLSVTGNRLGRRAFGQSQTPPNSRVSLQAPAHPRAGGGRAVCGGAGPGAAAAAGRVPVCGRPLGAVLLLHHHPQPHGHGLRRLAGAARARLPVGHAVDPEAQQALLDDGHCLHRGGPRPRGRGRPAHRAVTLPAC